MLKRERERLGRMLERWLVDNGAAEAFYVFTTEVSDLLD